MSEEPDHPKERSMTEVLIEVGGMTCDHCKRALEGAIGGLSGATNVSADYQTGRVTASFPEAPDPAAIRTAVEEEGYDLLGVSMTPA
jgi:copper chaperone